MRMFRYECRKLLQCWFLWLLLGVFLIFDIFLVWEYVERDRKEYQDMYQIIMQTGTELNPEVIENMQNSQNETESYYAEYVRTYESIYDDLDIFSIRDDKINMSVDFKPTGRYQEWLDKNYQKLEQRVQEIRDTGESRAGFYAGLSYRVHSALFSSLLHPILLEIFIMTAFSVLYLMDYERLNKTELLTNVSKTGRNLQIIKCISGTVFSFLYALILTGFPLILFFICIPMHGLWKTPVSSFMMMESRGGFIYPFITFVRLSFRNYFILFLLMMILLILLMGMISGAVQFFSGNSYLSMLCIGIGFLGFMGLPYLFGSGFMHTAMILNPACLWYICGGWFIEYDPAISFAWSEFWTVGIWMIFSLIALYFGKRHYFRMVIA